MMDAERGPALPAANATRPARRRENRQRGLPVVFMHAATGSSRVWH